MGPAVVRHPDLLFAAFNQDFSCLSVGTRKGYAIVNCEPFGRVHAKNEGPTGLVEMLFCTSLVALVGAPGADGSSRSSASSSSATPGSQARESPRRLQIVNTKRQSTICELLFPTSVLAVKLNRKRMVVVLEEEIYIYDVSTMKLLHTIETSPNPNAICALASSSENSIIAYPAPLPPPSSSSGGVGSAGGVGGSGTSGLPPASIGSGPASQPGDVVLFDALTLTTVNVIQAHKAPLAQLALNSTGTLLASASETGTVIRVWQVPGAEKVAQFRRGTYPARVCSLNFNLVSSLLAVASDSDTIHIYKLPSVGGLGSSSNGSNGGGGPPHLASHTSSASFDSTTSSSAGNGGPSPQPTTASGGSHSPASSLRRKTFGFAGSYVGSYLPTGVRDLWTPERDFAHVRLRSGGVRCVVALSPSSPQVFVISETGLFHAYSLDLEKGGECILMKEFPLITNDDPAVSEI